jgi:hypothetical protein
MTKCFVCPSNDAVIENQNTMTHDDQCALGTTPKITTKEIEFLSGLKPLPFEERANRVLLHIAKQTKVYGASIRLFGDPKFFAIVETFKVADAQFILRYLQDRKYVQFINDEMAIRF